MFLSDARRSTGSGLLPFMVLPENSVRQIVSVRVKTLSNTNLLASRDI